MELIGLAILAGTAVAVNSSDTDPNTYNCTESKPPSEFYERYARDFADAGIPYSLMRSANQGQAQIGTSYAPLSYPSQKPTYECREIFDDAAETHAVYESRAPQYFFNQFKQLGISYGAPTNNNGYNIGVQVEGISFPGDPDFSLAKLGKVFVERYRPSDVSDYAYGRHFMGAGESSMNLRPDLPNEADVAITERNPYGNIGHYQLIMNNRLYDFAAEKGHLKPDVLHAPNFKKVKSIMKPQIPGVSNLY